MLTQPSPSNNPITKPTSKLHFSIYNPIHTNGCRCQVPITRNTLTLLDATSNEHKQSACYHCFSFISFPTDNHSYQFCTSGLTELQHPSQVKKTKSGYPTVTIIPSSFHWNCIRSVSWKHYFIWYSEQYSACYMFTSVFCVVFKIHQYLMSWF